MPAAEIPIADIQPTQPAANILPPPDDLTLPIVKLLTHPTYRSYQSHTASLSLFANLFVNFLPPAWGAPTPPTPAPPSSANAEKAVEEANKLKNEWKRRIKMYSAYCPSSRSRFSGRWICVLTMTFPHHPLALLLCTGRACTRVQSAMR